MPQRRMNQFEMLPVACAAGAYRDSSMSMCTKCDTNTISAPGASVCTGCDPGTVSNGDRTECGKFRLKSNCGMKVERRRTEVKIMSCNDISFKRTMFSILQVNQLIAMDPLKSILCPLLYIVMGSAPHKDLSICNAFRCMCGRNLQRFKHDGVY